ncbi:Pullulanase 1, chloroplastic-like protein [Gossypium australe]|uniref:Pullulanase 1, chloroplastic-like protein n=1 Tax=Gossypium australe TaxID=47621 RepID=A0A5B6U9E8_9ROSI|nr:Pullulanase 1, chloroplastic-like protein [Gossypium australe]
MVDVLCVPFPVLQSSPSLSFKPRLCPLIPPSRRLLHLKSNPLLFPLFSSSPSFFKLPLRCSSSSTPLQLSSLSQDSLLYSRAYWVTKTIIAWNVDVGEGSCYLYASKVAALSVTDNGIQGHDLEIKLEEDRSGLPPNVIEKFPHIRDYKAFKLPPVLDAKNLVKCQLAVAEFNSQGKCRNATGLQLPGVLDELFSYDGPLGAFYSAEAVSLCLWAPTAQAVYAHIYKDPLGGSPLEIIPLEETNGVWSTKGPKSWEGCYYMYEVSVYHPSTLHIEKCYANDPYARGLSADGKRTLFVNLHADDLKPEGWNELADMKPDILSFSDISIYELHIRDFSANDDTVNADFRGGYMAFTLKDSAGVLHLKKLSKAGITHVHLLPTFQFAAVDDEKENWKYVANLFNTNSIADSKILEKLPPDSAEQQEKITAIQDDDAYNWGYNPVLWGVPKGSYSSDPNGPCRIVEFRKMIQALTHIGLRVVLDVVYNHLHANGPFDKDSVLDKIVPGYYLRRNTDGFIENSTCVNNTASEHYMVERLIIDDLLSWAINYKVDGFRFDLMGHIMKRTMVKAKDALCSLTKERDGVDGSRIYIYGEGWDFGEVAKNGRGINASQFNICGTGIGSFNDRIRDAMLGGSPFGPPLQQGFVTGLLLESNGHDHGTKDVEKAMLASAKDHIQVGLAANLRDFVLTDFEGKERKGSEVLCYGGTPVGYALCPTETDHQLDYTLNEMLNLLLEVFYSVTITYYKISMVKEWGYSDRVMETLDLDRDQKFSVDQVNYVSAHDNETLFDIVSLKTPVGISVEDRCRMNHFATSIIALTQGIPFFHAGDEMLRSKSLDRDSYNSGDWFNRSDFPFYKLDFSYNSNNWGVGLPPKQKNENSWALIQPRLADPSFKPQRSHILAAVENFKDVLRIRYSSPLFRLRTANAIQVRKAIYDFCFTRFSLRFYDIVVELNQGYSLCSQERVRFHNTGPSWVPGFIVMSIEDGNEGIPGLSQLDPVFSYIVVVFNACPTEESFSSPTMRGRTLQLHPIQVTSTDETVKKSSYEASTGCFTVPARTTSVFVEPRKV